MTVVFGDLYVSLVILHFPRKLTSKHSFLLTLIQLPVRLGNKPFLFLRTTITIDHRPSSVIHFAPSPVPLAEYVPDPDVPALKNATVKTVIMLVFRDSKSAEEEVKGWQFWHARQHSVKQRILDADTKNSMGIVSNIEEISHNALAVYWNPLESPAKVGRLHSQTRRLRARSS